MTSDPIEFNKKREIGDIISDTFKFLRKNLKPLFSILLKTLLVPYILLVVAVAFYSVATSDMIDTFAILDNLNGSIANIIISVVVLAVMIIIYSGMLYGTVSEYIKEYKKTQGEPNIETILQQVKRNSGRYISLSFWNLLYVFGFPILLMILGGMIIGSIGFIGGILILGAFIYIIYLYTRYAVIFPSHTHRRTTITSSFVSSTELTRNEWWNTFLTLFLLGLITGAISFVFQIPTVIYVISQEFVSTGEYSSIEPSTDWILVVFQTVSSSVGYLLYIIPALAVNFIYFNLSERKNQTGSLEKIDTIGSTNEE